MVREPFPGGGSKLESPTVNRVRYPCPEVETGSETEEDAQIYKDRQNVDLQEKFCLVDFNRDLNENNKKAHIAAGLNFYCFIS